MTCSPPSTDETHCDCWFGDFSYGRSIKPCCWCGLAEDRDDPYTCTDAARRTMPGMDYRMLSNIGGYERGTKVSAKDLDALGQGDTPFSKTLLESGHVEKWDGSSEMPEEKLVLGREPLVDSGTAPPENDDDNTAKASSRRR